MAFKEAGWKTLSHIGTPDITTSGSHRAWHTYITTDDVATLETANYFDLYLARMKDGDLLTVVGGIGATSYKRDYVVDLTTSAGHVLVKREGGAAGKGLFTLSLFINLADIAANASMLTAYVPGFNFKLEAFDFRVHKPATTAAKLATIQPQISGVSTTGGALALTSANCTPAGAAVAGSAITALNTGAATDSIGLLSSGVTAFVEGSGWLFMKIRNTDE